MEEFKRDLDLLLTKLLNGVDRDTKRRLTVLKNRLVHLYEKNLVKINHSVMELVCAKRLISKGYEVMVEHTLTDKLVCDLYAIKGDGTMILEIETGFVPPENALDPLNYWEARISSKIARYSIHSNKFCLGTPPHHILQIPPMFLTPPRERDQSDLRRVKSMCDKYYTNPPLSYDELRYGLLHTIYVINVDKGEVREFDPTTYLKTYHLI